MSQDGLRGRVPAKAAPQEMKPLRSKISGRRGLGSGHVRTVGICNSPATTTVGSATPRSQAWHRISSLWGQCLRQRRRENLATGFVLIAKIFSSQKMCSVVAVVGPSLQIRHRCLAKAWKESR